MSGQDMIYEMITDRIIDLMEKGTVPWRKPWKTAGVPMNMVSKKPYRGINLFFLNAAPYSSNLWMSFKQVSEKKGKVKKGEKGYPVVFWKFMEKEKEDGEKFSFPFLRYYTVFNVEQTDMVIPKVEEEVKEVNPIETSEILIRNYKTCPPILLGKAAFYSPREDTITVPDIKTFDKTEQYYSVLFHEMVHSTGHKTRLNRFDPNEIPSFGSQSYSKEELVAEMGASYLCGHCGIFQETEENSAAYIDGWLSRLRKDKKLLIQAAGKAQIASDYILGKEWNND